MSDSSRKRPLAPLLPPGVDLKAVFQGVPFWHQQWEIFAGEFTPGRNPVVDLLDRVGFPDDLSGKRVLDIGAWNGCFSFECERRGASEVIALDVWDPDLVGFNVLRDLIGSTKIRYQFGSVYNLDPHVLGQFDVVLFLGVLYHLRYPLLALDQIRKVSRGALYLETVVIDHRFVEGGKDFQRLGDYHPALPEVPIWQFYKGTELAGDSSNWFGPNIRAVIEGLESAGFLPKLMDTWGDRAAFYATPDGPGTMPGSYEWKSPKIRNDLAL